jgi:hypothetical protein
MSRGHKGRSRGRDPHILKLINRKWWVSRLRFQSIYRWNELNRKLGGHQNRSGHFGDEVNFLPKLHTVNSVGKIILRLFDDVSSAIGKDSDRREQFI